MHALEPENIRSEYFPSSNMYSAFASERFQSNIDTSIYLYLLELLMGSSIFSISNSDSYMEVTYNIYRHTAIKKTSHTD